MGLCTGAFMKKKIASLILALSISLPLGVTAQPVSISEYYIGRETEKTAVYFGGEGTAENPYIISDPNDLRLLASLTNQGHGTYQNAYYAMSADIDCAGISDYEPIGTLENPFSGHFDGCGYSVKNLCINSSDGGYIGLFGYTYNASVENLGVSAASIRINASQKCFVGAIAGFFGGNAGGGDVYVKRCSADGFISVKSTESSYVGGLFGQVGISGSVKYTLCDLCADMELFCETEKLAYAGGITGNVKNGARITRCASFGSVTASGLGDIGNPSAGGIAAWLQTDDSYIQSAQLCTAAELSDTSPDISDCISAMTVISKSEKSIFNCIGNISAYAVSEIVHSNLYCAETAAVKGSVGSLCGESVTSETLFSEGFLSANCGFDYENVWQTVLGKPRLQKSSPYIAFDCRHTDTAVKVSAEPVGFGDCTIIAVSYAKDRSPASVRTAEYSKNKSLIIEFDKSETLKLFVLGKSFSPLCASVTVYTPTSE